MSTKLKKRTENESTLGDGTVLQESELGAADTVLEFPPVNDTAHDVAPPVEAPQQSPSGTILGASGLQAQGPSGTILAASGRAPRGAGTKQESDADLGNAQTINAATDAKPAPATIAHQSLGGATILPRLRKGEEVSDDIVSAPTKRFDLAQRLGEGAAGAVDLALDNDIQRRVAIKWLKAADSDEAVLRFADEVRMVGHLEHPNIVPIHDVGQTEDGRYYFVMKHVEGQTLEEVIAKLAAGDAEMHERYTFEMRTRIFTEILDAVEFAHHNGVIHRDIKPANVMVGPYGEVMVMDWGIAKQMGTEDEKGAAHPEHDGAGKSSATEPSRTSGDKISRLYETQDAVVIGTPLYMSPEQVRGQTATLDVRSDIYSLCALFYEFLTLRTYIEPQGTLQDTLRAVLTEKPQMPMLVRNRHQPPAPADLSHFVLKGLAKDPADRYQSIAEMRERIQMIREGYIPVQCPFTLTKRVTHGMLHQVDRHPIRTLSTLMLLLGGTIAGSIYLTILLGASG